MQMTISTYAGSTGTRGALRYSVVALSLVFWGCQGNSSTASAAKVAPDMATGEVGADVLGETAEVQSDVDSGTDSLLVADDGIGTDAAVPEDAAMPGDAVTPADAAVADGAPVAEDIAVDAKPACACGDGVCSAVCAETTVSCPGDCGSCGDGICAPGEGPKNCPADCCGGCGDGKCTGYDCGESTETCPVDCGTACGNKKCDKGETPSTCAQDCIWQVCGNGTCEPADGGPQKCPQDCGASCGDGSCAKGEDFLACPVDCGYCGDGYCVAALGETSITCVADCKAGECNPALPADVTKCDDGNPCLFDICAPSGNCKHFPVQGSCDDGNLCTTGDECMFGACLGSQTNCDDDNPCTIEICAAASGCGHVPGTAACDDGNPCTVGDTCTAGGCIGGGALACGDGNNCTTDACDPASGCTSTLADGVTCTDADACTAGDACAGGLCLAGPAVDCDDDNPCTFDLCKPETGCTHKAAGAACDDGNACTTADLCVNSVCTPGTALGCDDSDACTVDACDGAIGCTHAFGGGACDDANPCTSDDACSAGQCAGIANTAACDDGQPCTLSDKCASGVCAGKANACDDGSTCTADSCSAADGICLHSPLTGPVCADGDACTVGDGCGAGVCLPGNATPNCDDGHVCTADGCVAASGCQHVALAWGATCSADEVCDGAGTCVPSTRPAGMVLIPGATFWMGCNPAKDTACSPNESPQHKVTLSAYYMALTETTVGEYKACVDAGACSEPTVKQPNPYATYPGMTTAPVNALSWEKSRAYCLWRGAGFDLPTEAQWEMAARGSCEANGSNAADANCAKAMRTYPWGESAATCALAVMNDGGSACGTDSLWAVNSRPAGDSPYGIHDMAGNAAEWTLDWYGPYTAGDQTDPSSTTVAFYRVGRSGAFGNNAAEVRASYRKWASTSETSGVLGFRCSASTCAPGACDDGDACTADTCIPADASCVHTSLNGVACNDGDSCTLGDTCSGGACLPSGATLNCDDGSPCTTDSCNAATGCQHGKAAWGTPCDAKKLCDGAGSCVASTQPAGMVLVPAATFWMGCNPAKDKGCKTNESPQHKVTLSAYYMDLTETTVGQYSVCVDAGKCPLPSFVQPQPFAVYPGLTANPMSALTWTDARAYCQWRGAGFDLPTEAEWEMAARGSCEKNNSLGGDPDCAKAMRTYPWGETQPSCSFAVIPLGGMGCGKDLSWPVGSKPAGDSPYGLHDMIGNVAEWTRDQYGAYAAGDQTDPLGATSADLLVVRGASFSNATAIRASYRSGFPLTGSLYGDRGWRCTRPVCLAGACEDGNACTTDSCNAADGACVHLPLDGTACTDGNACTVGDGCSAGACLPGSAALNCDDGNVCTTDACTAANGCQHVPLAWGAACSAGKVCDGAAACVPSTRPAGMVLIPPATFWMGCNSAKDKACYPNESPQHKVTLSAYYMDLTETTVGQYEACVDAGVCPWPFFIQPQKYGVYPGLTANPMNGVTWSTARAHCQGRGPGFDLPTEAQWEMAARGSCSKNGSSSDDPNCATAMRTYPWGEAKPSCEFAVMNVGGVFGCGKDLSWPVGSKPAGDSPYGLHDMIGNVVEWTRDLYGAYTAGDVTDPLGPATAALRVNRGASFGADSASLLRASYRKGDKPAVPFADVGWRCVRQVCLAGACEDGNACTQDSCNAADDSCVHLLLTGTACVDGNACTVGDACGAGACSPGGAALDCDDGSACTTDSCSATSGCQHVALAVGAPCSGGGVCDGAGTCAAATGPKGMVLIPGGTFWMGCNLVKSVSCFSNEVPQHKVTLSAYHIDLTETTVAQYKACVDAGACLPAGESAGCNSNKVGKDFDPVNCLPWSYARAFCKWRGPGFDLPTEAQWEMSARGSCEKNGSSAGNASCKTAMRTYPWGETAPSCTYAVMSDGVKGCGTGSTWPVGSKLAGNSPYGLNDLAGNVWEWSRDWLGAYAGGDQVDPTGSTTGVSLVVRGGAADSKDGLRTSVRLGASPTANYTNVGLRCIRQVCVAAGCDDGNGCTVDSCNAADDSCVHTPLNGTSCSDGDACTQTDTCSNGSCVGANAVVCTNGWPCMAGGCQTQEGFEGDLSQWTITTTGSVPYAIVSTLAHSGSHAFQAKPSGCNGACFYKTTVRLTKTLSQPISGFTLSLWVYRDGCFGNTPRVAVNNPTVSADGPSVFDFPQYPSGQMPCDKWVKLSFTYTGVVNTITLIAWDVTGAAGGLLFDDIDIAK